MRRRLLFALTVVLAATQLVAPAAHAGISGPPPPPGSGGFYVIGDLSANVGATVQFWGAQWAKNNNLSGGGAPSILQGLRRQCQ